MVIGFELAPEDVFNADEFGLFWRRAPKGSFILKGQNFKSGKRSKVRISVFVFSNSTGTEKFKLVIIGKARKPRCFRGKENLLVMYRNHANS